MRLPKEYAAPTIAPESIIARVANARGVTIAKLRDRNRHPAVVQARHEAMWLIRRHTNLSSPEIGRLFWRDHSTVLAAVASVWKCRRRSAEYAADLDGVIAPADAGREAA